LSSLSLVSKLPQLGQKLCFMTRQYLEQEE
jgi:hypothetical protein